MSYIRESRSHFARRCKCKIPVWTNVSRLMTIHLCRRSPHTRTCALAILLHTSKGACLRSIHADKRPILTANARTYANAVAVQTKHRKTFCTVTASLVDIFNKIQQQSQMSLILPTRTNTQTWFATHTFYLTVFRSYTNAKDYRVQTFIMRQVCRRRVVYFFVAYKHCWNVSRLVY